MYYGCQFRLIKLFISKSGTCKLFYLILGHSPLPQMLFHIHIPVEISDSKHIHGDRIIKTHSIMFNWTYFLMFLYSRLKWIASHVANNTCIWRVHATCDTAMKMMISGTYDLSGERWINRINRWFHKASIHKSYIFTLFFVKHAWIQFWWLLKAGNSFSCVSTISVIWWFLTWVFRLLVTIETFFVVRVYGGHPIKTSFSKISIGS